MTEKAQLALTRMSLELQYANSIQSATNQKVVYTTTKDDSIGENQHSLEIESGRLLLDNHLLLDSVAGGTSFSYRNKQNTMWSAGDSLDDLAHVDIRIEAKHPTMSNLSFRTSIDIRNNGMVNAVAPIPGNL